MCMGFGCNAVGVVGCRIIDSKRERLIAMLTNVFSPCNGRFPTLIALISVFLISSEQVGSSFLSALVLSGVIVVSIITTLICSKLLSLTLLRGTPSSFTLELPPYRRPEFLKLIIRSVFDRTLLVLGRSVAFAAPAGIVLWILANVNIFGQSLLVYVSQALDPVGGCLGMDGAILLAFILALPANEIFIPIVLMIYSAGGVLTDYSSISQLSSILSANGWTLVTAICVILFTVFHFPCATTLLTVKKETGSLKWTFLAAVLPTAVGVVLCLAVYLLSKLFA